MINKRLVVLAITLVSLIVIIYFVTVAILRKDTGEVVFDILPTHAEIMIDNKKVGHGSNYLSEGSHIVTIKADGFGTDRRQIEVKKGEKQVILAALLPTDAIGEKWVSEHENLYKEFEEKGYESAQNEGKAIRSTFPIINLLPYEEPNFRIGYRAPKNGVLRVTVHAYSSLDRKLALAQIRSWGYDPADYEIDFVDYSNPLSASDETVNQREGGSDAE